MEEGAPSEMSIMNQVPPERLLSINISDAGLLTVEYEQVASRGLWRIEGGALVHLYLQFGEEGTKMIAEYFSGSPFSLVRYGMIPLDTREDLMPHWMDGQGNLYAAREDSALARILHIDGLFQP